MKVSFHPAARAELRRARAWYEERSPMSAAAVAQEIDAAISQIAEAPMRYPVAESGTASSSTVSLQHPLPRRYHRDRHRRGSSS